MAQNTSKVFNNKVEDLEYYIKTQDKNKFYELLSKMYDEYGRIPELLKLETLFLTNNFMAMPCWSALENDILSQTIDISIELYDKITNKYMKELKIDNEDKLEDYAEENEEPKELHDYYLFAREEYKWRIEFKDKIEEYVIKILEEGILDRIKILLHSSGYMPYDSFERAYADFIVFSNNFKVEKPEEVKYNSKDLIEAQWEVIKRIHNTPNYELLLREGKRKYDELKKAYDKEENKTKIEYLNQHFDHNYSRWYDEIQKSIDETEKLEHKCDNLAEQIKQKKQMTTGCLFWGIVFILIFWFILSQL